MLHKAKGQSKDWKKICLRCQKLKESYGELLTLILALFLKPIGGPHFQALGSLSALNFIKNLIERVKIWSRQNCTAIPSRGGEGRGGGNDVLFIPVLQWQF